MMTGNGQAVVELKNVHKAYGSRQALKGLDLQVEPGILFGLVGPNGAGEVHRAPDPAGAGQSRSGEIRLFGQKVKHVGPEQRARIGYLPSETEFYPEMRVKELLRYAAGLQKKTVRPGRRNCAGHWIWIRKQRSGSSPWADGRRQELSVPCSMIRTC